MTVMPAQPIMFAAGRQAAQPPELEAKQLAPEQEMNSRRLQPVRAGFLVGLLVLKEGDTTLGFAAAPTFSPGQGMPLGTGHMIMNAMARR